MILKKNKQDTIWQECRDQRLNEITVCHLMLIVNDDQWRIYIVKFWTGHPRSNFLNFHSGLVKFGQIGASFRVDVPSRKSWSRR